MAQLHRFEENTFLESDEKIIEGKKRIDERLLLKILLIPLYSYPSNLLVMVYMMVIDENPPKRNSQIHFLFFSS